MILNQEQELLETEGVSTQKSFTITASAKAFDILSNKLYTYKIRAIVRELICNAYDSVIEAKTNKKIKIHVPNSMEPYFSVKDCGVGLNEKEIEEIYTNVFASTKTQSNDLIGAFGLGSKSPFCYVDNFYRNSYKRRN